MLRPRENERKRAMLTYPSFQNNIMRNRSKSSETSSESFTLHVFQSLVIDGETYRLESGC